MTIKNTVAIFALALFAITAGCDKDEKKDSDDEEHMVLSCSPDSNATNVALNKVISVNFSEEMNAATFNNTTFTLKQGNTSITGAVYYSGTTATFNPSAQLAPNSVFTATITTGVKNKSGKAISENVSWSFTTGTNETGMEAVNLGAAGNYVILAKTAINNIPTSSITGDIGLSPAATTYITGFSLVDATGYATSSQVTGTVYAANMADPTPINLTTAVNDMLTAYSNTAGRTSPDFTELGTGNIGGKTLVPGLYKWANTVTVPTNVVISGSSTDVWIFQIGGDLTVSSGATVTLSGGAKVENIFWQVAGEVTLGTTSNFKGIILSMTGITLNKGAVFNGRALAQTAVILDSNTVTKP